MEIFSEGKSPPVLRFYQWMPSSVSIGYNQNPEDLINIDFCKKNNIHCVRRPTGGSAIFHDIELTYSFSATTSHRQVLYFFFLQDMTLFLMGRNLLEVLKEEIKILSFSMVQSLLI